MRKFLAGSLILLMTALSLNAGIAVHYCGGDLAQLKVVLGHGTATCGMEPDENRADRQQKIDAVPCCQDELRLIKVDDYQGAYQVSEPPQRFAFFGIPAPSLFDPLEAPSMDRSSARYGPPPDLNGVSLPFLQVFRI